MSQPAEEDIEVLLGQALHTARRLGGVVEGASAEKLSSVVDVCRTVLARFEGLLVGCADRAVELDSVGEGSPAEVAVAGRSGSSSVSIEEGRRLVNRSVLTSELAKTAEVVRDGDAPVGSVDSLCRALRELDGDERDEFLALDGEISRRIVSSSVAGFSRWVHRTKRRLQTDDGEKTLEEQEAASSVSWWRTSDGRMKILADVDLLRGEEAVNWILSKARSTLTRHNSDGDDSLSPDVIAEAFIELLAGGALGGEGVPAPNRITVVVDHRTATTGQAHSDTICETYEGHPVPAGRLARYACDAVLESVAIGFDGEAFNEGRTKRSASARQRKALRVMYPRCPLSGTPFRDCEIHHVKWFEKDDGPTDLDNLLPISMRWHHLIHDQGWTITMNPDRSLELRRPDGHLHQHIPYQPQALNSWPTSLDSRFRQQAPDRETVAA